VTNGFTTGVKTKGSKNMGITTDAANREMLIDDRNGSTPNIKKINHCL
jgi:hypothetical protein